MCLQFCSDGHPRLPVPAPPAVHRAVLAHVTGQQAGTAGFAQPMPLAATSTNGSIIVTCAFSGGHRVAFPRQLIVEGYRLRLAAVGQAIGIDAGSCANKPAAAISVEMGNACVAFDMHTPGGGPNFVRVAPVTRNTLHVAELLQELQHCNARTC